MSNSNPQAITCKAVVCWGKDGPFKLEDIEVEAPKPCEVRLKMLYASICHTDILYSRRIQAPLFPRVFGHEGAGVVESVGEEVKDVKEGELVIPTYIGECQECENCTSGVSNLCLKYPLTVSGLMLDGTSRMSVRGQKLYHMFSCSTWSEYTVVNANYVLKLDPSIAFSHATFLSCGFSSGFGAAWKDFKVEKGSSVAVFGLGAVGLGAVEGARIQGAAKIIGIDTNPWKKEKGKAFGMNDFINPSESDKSISDLIKDITDGIGVDYSFECSGVPALANEALLATKMGKGKAMIIGVGHHEVFPIAATPLVLGRTLKGSAFGGLKTKSDLPIVLEKCKNKEFQLDELLTHEVAMEDIEKAFELLKQPDCIKVLIKI